LNIPHHDRLRAWLGLPPGPWPPNHYELLGLARGAGDLADIENRVLERMERLRPHQLLHPELVTEGMNRLAQALVCLTDPVARSAYDRELGIPPPPFEVVEDEPPQATSSAGSPPGPAMDATAPAEVPFEPGLRPPDEPQQPADEVVWEPEPVPIEVPLYEVVPDDPTEEPLPLPPAYEVVPDEPHEQEVLPLEPAPPPPTPGRARGTSPGPISRRAVYRKLAALRRALRAWERLRPVFGTPAEALATPVAVLLCVRALAEARAALPGVAQVIRGPRSPGGTVAALVRLPHALHAVRVLLPTQRQAVALDWRRGYDALLRERTRLRELAFAARPRRKRTSAIARLCGELRQTPEWVLLVVALGALGLALFRVHAAR
jgi:hypothetical protein